MHFNIEECKTVCHERPSMIIFSLIYLPIMNLQNARASHRDIKLVGSSSGVRGYKLWCLQEKNIVTSRDVIRRGIDAQGAYGEEC